MTEGRTWNCLLWS